MWKFNGSIPDWEHLQNMLDYGEKLASETFEDSKGALIQIYVIRLVGHIYFYKKNDRFVEVRELM